jgi:peptidoglycan/xylan/chitin deacetylase (PgdA/CDA1 family)
MHGFVHEAWGDLDPDEEVRLARRATDALQQAAGVRPRGFRAPGGRRTAHTETILSDLGYEYDASLGDGTNPARLPGGMAQIPFVWPAVDGFHYLRQPPARPADVAEGWLRELDKAASHGGLFLLVCHAFLTGVDDERLAGLDAVIAAACADPRIRVCTLGELARDVIGKPSGG